MPGRVPPLGLLSEALLLRRPRSVSAARGEGRKEAMSAATPAPQLQPAPSVACKPLPTTGPRGSRIDLFQLLPPLGWLAKQRWFQFAAVLPNLVFFTLFLGAGIFGTPVGNRNIIIVFVWILWWFLLISVLVPFASRIWC